MHDSDHRKGGVGANKALEYIIALERIKDRLRRYAKNPKGVMLEPTLEDAAERIEELEREVLDLKVANDELIAENHEAVAAERERQSDRIEELEAEVNHFKKLWANAEIDAAAYRSGYRDD